MDKDLALAKKLQQEYDREDNMSDTDGSHTLKEAKIKPQQKLLNEDDIDLNQTKYLVHPEWETLDPTPDVFSLKNVFDNKFFRGRLECVTLEWSKKMYSCAGICYSQKNNFGMSIIIRLSEPLLKLRTRKNLVETLLHEMIHAYCFVINIREGNGGHGPYFKKIMQSINQVAGTNISVYHTFLDEVNLYKTHWWRCNGICQHHKPFFGFVKRTSNRVPGPNDLWWAAHQTRCGGSFLKVREPPPKKSGPKKKEPTETKSVKPQTNLYKFFGTSKKTGDFFAEPNLPHRIPGSTTSNNYPKGTTKTNGAGSLLTNPKPSTQTSGALEKDNNLSNSSVPGTVVGLKDLNNISPKTANVHDLTGKGYSLLPTTRKSKSIDDTVDRNKMRDIWSKKFPISNIKIDQKSNSTLITDDIEKIMESDPPPKKRRLLSESDNCWLKINDDIEICDNPVPLIDISSDEDDGDNNNDLLEPKKEPAKQLTQQEFQTQIKNEILENSDFEDSDIEIIDGEFYEDNSISDAEVTDTSLVDDLFGEDTLLSEFYEENAVIPSNSQYSHDPDNDIVSCPICQEKIKRNDFEGHLDGCGGVTRKVLPKSGKEWAKEPSKAWPKLVHKPANPQFGRKTFKKPTRESIIRPIRDNEIPPTRDNINRSLRNAGYSETEILQSFATPTPASSGSSSSSNDHLHYLRDSQLGNTNQEYVLTSEDLEIVSCPACSIRLAQYLINDHLDNCLL